MKKIIFSFLCVALSSAAFAQSVRLGMKAGVDFSVLSYGSNDKAFLAGFNAGAFADIGLHKGWSLQPGIFFMNKGGIIRHAEVIVNGSPVGTGDLHVRLDDIEVPVNLLYQFKTGRTSFYAAGGPYLAWNLGTRVSADKISYYNYDSSSGNVQGPAFKNPDAGLSLLAGIVLANKFTGDIGYDLGLSNIGNGGTSTRTRVIRLSIGYVFR